LVTGNLFNQLQAVCDAEVTRITAEIAARPVLVAGACIISNATPTIIDCTWTNNKFPPLATADNAKFSATVAGSGRTINSTVVVGTNITRHTLASAVSGGQAVLLTGTLGAVVNSGRVGGTWISDLADSAAFSNFTVTNNVAVTPTHVFTQVGYQFVRENNQIDTNTPINLTPGSVLLVKVQVDATVADPPQIGMQLRYSRNSGAYTIIPDVAGADKIKFIGNSQFSPFIPIEGTAITSCLSGALTVVNGAVQRTSSAVPNINMTQDDCTMNGYGIVFEPDATVGDTYDFRLYNQDQNPLNAYALTGRATIAVFPGVEAGAREQAVGRTAATGRTQAGIRAQVIQ
jgi:hypothetical protein